MTDHIQSAFNELDAIMEELLFQPFDDQDCTPVPYEVLRLIRLRINFLDDNYRTGDWWSAQ